MRNSKRKERGELSGSGRKSSTLDCRNIIEAVYKLWVKRILNFKTATLSNLEHAIFFIIDVLKYIKLQAILAI